MLQLSGVTMAKLAMISEWMENGNIKEFVKAHTDVDTLELVCVLFKIIILVCH